jgi:hypothetical protein
MNEQDVAPRGYPVSGRTSRRAFMSEPNSHERTRLMSLVFALRLTVLGLGLLAVSLCLFALSLTSTREWETLFVLFSVFVLCVSYVLIFIRLSGNIGRLLLLTPGPMFFLTGEKLILVGLWIGALLVLEAFRRESFGGRSFLLTQMLLGLGGLVVALAPSGRLMLGGFWAVVLVAPVLVAAGCWEWQRTIKEELTEYDLDED